MKIIFLFIFLTSLLFIATSEACKGTDPPIEKIKNIYWKHSHEDDKGDTIAYRPKSFNFPPSRGREGFELKDKGIFIKYAIAPTDGIIPLEGRWEQTENPYIVSIQLNENSEYKFPLPADYKMQIVGYNEQDRILKIIMK